MSTRALSAAVLLTAAKTRKQPQRPLVDERIKRMWWMYSTDYDLSLEKEGNLAICNDVDEPRGHYVKRNKPDRDTGILCSITYMWNLF